MYGDYGAVVACMESMSVEVGTDANVEVNGMYNRERREEKGQERGGKTGQHSMGKKRVVIKRMESLW